MITPLGFNVSLLIFSPPPAPGPAIFGALGPAGASTKPPRGAQPSLPSFSAAFLLTRVASSLPNSLSPGSRFSAGLGYGSLCFHLAGLGAEGSLLPRGAGAGFCARFGALQLAANERVNE